jgi:glycosyltransferase involved in cell wall biosynthesis
VTSKVRIVIATGSLTQFPEGGGVWAWILQYVNGLRALGHEVFLIDRFNRSGHAREDELRISVLQERMTRLGLCGRWAVLAADQGKTVRSLHDLVVHGVSENTLRKEIRDADLLWNFARTLGPALLDNFKRTVLLDGDPGVLQVSALHWDMQLDRHDVVFTAASKINDADCAVPKLGLNWRPFLPPIYLPAWQSSPDPDEDAPVTSVTQWNWGEEFALGDRVFSDSKRQAYLRYIDLPRLCRASFTLAAHFYPNDRTGEIDLLRSRGWNVVDPHQVAGDPESYGDFIRSSRCELGCAKPIFVDLKTGWFSERSATYLACGRPVLAENTGFPDHIETGRGLLAFSNVAEAASAVESLMANYSMHRKAARELAATYFSSDRVLAEMVEASF